MENFLQILVEDEKVREEFLRQTTPEGAYRVAKPFLDEMTIDEFIDELRGVARVMDSVGSGQLSEEHLCMVTGGSFSAVMQALSRHF